MTEFSTKDMTEYLKMAMELESSVYRQQEVICKGKKELQWERPIKERIQKPQKYTISDKIPEKSKILKQAESPFTKFAHKFLIPILIPLTIMEIVIIGDDVGGSWPLMLVVWDVLMLVGIFNNKRIIKTETIKYEKELHEYEKEVQENEKRYETLMEKYQKNFDEAEKNYSIQVQAHSIAQKALEQMEKPLAETQKILEQLYSVNIIHPKYRNMIAMCSIYEYFSTGRCTELTGADGAYNLYETELRLDRISNQLDEIIYQLDEIRANQYALYTELKRTNDILAGISSDINELKSSVHKIEDYSHITACCAQVTAQNTEALKYITLING